MHEQAYVSGNALVILTGPRQLLQTIYHDDHDILDGVALDEASGKIAVCCGSTIHVYRPYGLDIGALRVRIDRSWLEVLTIDAYAVGATVLSDRRRVRWRRGHVVLGSF